MKAFIILGNTRAKSNTEALADVFAEALAAKGINVSKVSLREKNIQTCVGCERCHSIPDSFGCGIKDDMPEIANEILASDLIVFASPIYTWLPTPPLKAVMDRIYAFAKFPEDAECFNLLKNQKFAMITTCFDNCEENCDLFDETIRRMANFAKISYLGHIAARDSEDGFVIGQEVINEAENFAEKCAIALRG